MTGKELRRIRKEMGLTQKEMSVLLRVHSRTLQGWEKKTNNLRAPTILQIERVYNDFLVSNNKNHNSFYEALNDYKKTHNIKYKELGGLIRKNSDAMRMAIKRRSLTDLEIEKINNLIGVEKEAASEDILDKYKIYNPLELEKLMYQYLSNVEQLFKMPLVKMEFKKQYILYTRYIEDEYGNYENWLDKQT